MHREGQPAGDFTVVYHLLSFDRNADVRIKVAAARRLARRCPPSPTSGRPPNWYEREVWDMFGIGFDGHPHLRRILMPPLVGGPSAAQGTPGPRHRNGPVPPARREGRPGAGQPCSSSPEEWGLTRQRRGHRLHVPQPRAAASRHPRACCGSFCSSTARRSSMRCRTSAIHHRGAEKMGERQSWHTYIPYTDRVDYLGGVMNNLAYVLAVEKLAGIEVPDRGQGHPRHAVRAVPDHQPPGLVRHVRRRTWARCRRCSTCSPTASAPSTSSRRSAAPGCTPTGSASAASPRTCRKAGTDWCREFSRLPAAPPRRVRQDRDAKPHLQSAHAGRRPLYARTKRSNGA